MNPDGGPTRNEEDCLAHLQRLIASDPAATKWHILVDNLNTHQSESLVCWIAEQEGIKQETASASKARVAFSSQWPPVRPFCMIRRTRSSSLILLSMLAFMNQVEIWLSILVRKLLKRGNFGSLEDLKEQILAFVAYYNRTMAHPFKWTYQGLTVDG